MTYIPWWRHLLGIPTAVAILFVWIIVLPGGPWPGVVVLGLVIAGDIAFAILSYRSSRRRVTRWGRGG